MGKNTELYVYPVIQSWANIHFKTTLNLCAYCSIQLQLPFYMSFSQNDTVDSQ